VIPLTRPISQRAKNANKRPESVADVCDKSLKVLPTSATNRRMCALFRVIQLTVSRPQDAQSKAAVRRIDELKTDG
jgi:hypothetical protein